MQTLDTLLKMAPFAAVATIAAFWQQLKGFFTRVSSTVLVSFEVQSPLGDALMFYLWENFRFGTLAQRRFGANDYYIRPLERRGMVGMEFQGESLTFFKNFKPLFTSSTKDSNTVRISFIRGTFKIEDLLKEAINKRNERLWASGRKTKRYYVRRYFGRSATDRDNDKAIASTAEDNIYEGSRPLHWRRDELGMPLSEEPFEHLFYGTEVNTCLAHIKNWMEAEKWYRERGLPWRQGVLFEGPPGNGKTSFTRAVAQLFDLPVKIFDLPSMNNEELVRFWHESLENTPCIVLFEDIDRVFDKDKNLRASTVANKQPVTMDCLLNCINGIEPSDGILVVVTANDISKLDAALGVPDANGNSTRPGRLDISVHFGPPDEQARLGIAKKILCGFEELIPQVVRAGAGDSGAQFQFRCARIAEIEYWNRLRPKEQRVSYAKFLTGNAELTTKEETILSTAPISRLKEPPKKEEKYSHHA